MKINNIKILGAGCSNCKKLLEHTRQAAESLGLELEIEYITDMKEIMAYGAMSMPVLLVNDKVAAQGKVLKVKNITKILQSLAVQGAV